MLGIVLTEYLTIPTYGINSIFLLLLVCLFHYRKGLKRYTKRWIPGIIIYSSIFVMGYIFGTNYQELNQANHFQQFLEKENYLIGVITNTPKVKNGKFIVEMDAQSIAGETKKIQSCKGKVLIYLRNDTDSLRVKYGDQLCIKGKITPLEEAKNPNVFNYKSYLYFKNIHYQAFIPAEQWSVVKTAQATVFSQAALGLRSRFLEVLKKHIPAEDEAAIASALILGYKDNLSDDLKAAYAESGAIHVLAVSGLHVGIVSYLLLFFLNLFPSNKKVWKWIKLGLILLTIWSFALLTGMPTSVQRAAFMFTVLHTGRVIDREVNIYNSLAIAAFIILLIHPFAIFEVGFQFSFLAVTGIVFFFPKFRKVWCPKNKLADYFWQLTLVGFSAQLAVLPLSLYYFHQFPTYFLLTGLFIIPLAAVILYAGLGLLFLSFISETLAAIFGEGIYYIIHLQNWLIEKIQFLPFNLLEGFWLNSFEVLLLYCFIIGIGLRLIVRNFQYVRMAFGSLLLVSCIQVQKGYQTNYQQKITIYSINKHSAMDFIDGDKLYAFASNNFPEKAYSFIIKNNRFAEGIKQVIDIKELERREVGKKENANFYKKGNYIQFYNKRLVLVNQALPKKRFNSKKLDCDYIIIQNNPKISIAEVLKYYRTREIIVDGSNSNWNIEKWKAECVNLDSSVFKDIRNDGAYIIHVKTNKSKGFIEVKDLAQTKHRSIHSPEPASKFLLSSFDD